MPTAAENYKDRPIIIYSPPGTGKTRSSQALAKHFGKSAVVEEWNLGDSIYENALHLTSDERVSKIVCITRLPKPPAYVFRLADLKNISGLNYIPPAIEEVQTSAPQEAVMPIFTPDASRSSNPVVLALLGFAIAVITVFYYVMNGKS